MRPPSRAREVEGRVSLFRHGPQLHSTNKLAPFIPCTQHQTASRTSQLLSFASLVRSSLSRLSNPTRETFGPPPLIIYRFCTRALRESPPFRRVYRPALSLPLYLRVSISALSYARAVHTHTHPHTEVLGKATKDTQSRPACIKGCERSFCLPLSLSIHPGDMVIRGICIIYIGEGKSRRHATLRIFPLPAAVNVSCAPARRVVNRVARVSRGITCIMRRTDGPWACERRTRRVPGNMG